VKKSKKTPEYARESVFPKESGISPAPAGSLRPEKSRSTKQVLQAAGENKEKIPDSIPFSPSAPLRFFFINVFLV
jgi:hypothetical protein